MLNIPQLMTPEHVHGATSPADYERRQMRSVHDLKRSRPKLYGGLTLWDAPDGAIVFVTGGKLCIFCACGDAPSAHPDWDVARCFACGGVYRRLAWPADLKAIETVLIARRWPRQRNWMPGASVRDLQIENIEAGDPIEVRR